MYLGPESGEASDALRLFDLEKKGDFKDSDRGLGCGYFFWSRDRAGPLRPPASRVTNQRIGDPTHAALKSAPGPVGLLA